MICKNCYADKDLSNFSKDSKAKSGHYYICRLCQHDKRVLYYKVNKNKELYSAITYYRQHRVKQRENNRRWLKDNAGIVNARIATRNCNKLKATPSWSDKEKIKSIYKEAKKLTDETGIKHHVDHIVPLKNDLVCGLHVFENLRIIPASENLRKKNKFEAKWESLK